MKRHAFEALWGVLTFLLIAVLSEWAFGWGPYQATLVSAYDGDTITVRARIFADRDPKFTVRLSGVDTPEIRGKCPEEKELAIQARDFVIQRMQLGGEIVFQGKDKYGRWLAQITVVGQDLAQTIIDAGLGRSYDGGRRQGWC